MVSIIIVNYNQKDLLKKCLDSARGQDFQDIEVIVVDNASSDGSAEMIGTYYPKVGLIRNTRNLLLCKAYNQGIKKSKGDFVLCLNNDVILDRGYLQEAISAAGLDGKIGMVSGKILRMDKETIDSTGLFPGRNRKAVERGYGKQDKGQFDKPGYIFGVSGAAAFFRRRMLEDIKDENGYFDERFEMYYEDLDLSWRAQKIGWKAYYAPRARAYHVRAATALGRAPGDAPIFPDLPGELKKRYIRNRHLCIKKNDGLLGYLLNLPFIVLYDIKLFLYMIFKRSECL